MAASMMDRAAAGVRVIAPARLHLGLIDMNGDLGRRYGSIGLAIDEPSLSLVLRHGQSLTATGPEAERALRYAREAAELIGLPAAAAITVERAIPAHAGFGSGTQLALAMAAGLAKLHGRPIDIAAVGARLDRGARSGIGLSAFQTGGFVVDGGRGETDAMPPVIARMAMPADWRIVLILDETAEGVHGEAELEAFRSLPRFPAETAGHLCRLVMMKLLPGLAEADIGAVGSALTEIQARVGDHFAPAQGGRRFASERVAELLNIAAEAGAAGVGQTSWGPTGFALVGSDAEAERLMERLVRNCHTDRGLSLRIVHGRNRGARLRFIR